MVCSYRFLVSGTVQGVGFRRACMEEALALGLNGWARNREDGCVEGQVDGEETQRLEKFRAFLWRGPAVATVDHLEWEPSKPSGESGFRILHS